MSGISQVTLHPWCRDIPRDEAVRASEDNRKGPLPTLEECIERQTARPCGGADPAPSGGEPGGAANGLRTERVTLEVTHHCRFPLNEWLLEMVEEVTSDPGESVRVVDESAPAASDAAGKDVAEIAQLAFDAGFGSSREGFNGECSYDHLAPKGSTFEGDGSEPYEKLKRDSVAKIMSEAASVAAGTEPDAWGVRRNGLVDCVAHRSSRKSAEGSAEQWGGVVVPLYAAPQAAKGWLTPEERGSIQLAANIAKASLSYSLAQELENILARSTPPEVVA